MSALLENEREEMLLWNWGKRLHTEVYIFSQCHWFYIPAIHSKGDTGGERKGASVWVVLQNSAGKGQITGWWTAPSSAICLNPCSAPCVFISKLWIPMAGIDQSASNQPNNWLKITPHCSSRRDHFWVIDCVMNVQQDRTYYWGRTKGRLHISLFLRPLADMFCCPPSLTSKGAKGIFACRQGARLGLASTVYIHRLRPYAWWFPCRNYRVYTLYVCGSVQPYARGKTQSGRDNEHWHSGPCLRLW